MADRIRPLKLESPATGGTELDEFPTAVDPSEDHIDARGFFIQNDTSDDEDVHITRDASSPDNMMFQDEVVTTAVTLSQLLNGAPGAEPVGFPNRDDSTLSFVDATRTFTISPAVSSFDFYVEDGVKYTKTSGQSVVIPDTEGIHYIYFDTSGVLQSTTTWSDDIILKYAIVVVIYWDATNDEAIYLGEERHGIVMDGVTHLHWHNTFGTSFYSGLALNSLLTDQDGSLDTHAQLGTDSGVIADEDLIHNINAKTAPAQIAVIYKTGSSGYWRRDTATNFPVKSFSGGSGRLAWNEYTGGAWQQTEVSNNNFVLCHLFAINDSTQQWFAIQGEDEYSNIAAARAGSLTELTSLILGGLPLPEFLPVATVIFQTSNSYSNTPKARTRTTDEGADWIDWRFTNVSPTTPPQDLEGLHKTLRHLVHLAEEGGPWDGFSAAPYQEFKTGSGPWDYGYIWWESSSKVNKIIEKTISYNANVTPSTIVWVVYDVDGSTALVTATDTYAYTGGALKPDSVTRTFS